MRLNREPRTYPFTINENLQMLTLRFNLTVATTSKCNSQIVRQLLKNECDK